MSYWDEKMETMDKESLKRIQSERLKDTVERVYKNVPYYRDKMKAAGITSADINSVDDLFKLPFTLKTDLRDNYPFGTFALPLKDIVRVHASSGTTGKQTVVGYTQNDIEIWAECVARCLSSVGINEDDIVHVAYGYGLFTGGLGLHYGAERVGATVIPVSGGNTARQIQLLRDFEATVLCCTPSYALHIADQMRDAGISKDDLKLKIGIFGAEPWSEEMKLQLENLFDIKAYDIYGLSEIMGPGVSMNCDCQGDLHIISDHFIAEVIDPDTGQVLPEGSEGELVFTCITKEALPLIRYRTKDLSVLNSDVCVCGRSSTRMKKVTGRADDMIIIRGVNVFPSQIESVLLKHSEVDPHYMIYVDRINNLDIMEIHIEMNQSIFSDQVRKIEGLERKIRHEIESTLGIGTKIRLVEPNSIKRSEGKATRVIDKRKLY